MNALHGQHRCTTITDKEKIRTRYNYVATDKRSPFKKEYKTPRLVIKNQKNLTKLQITNLEASHGHKHEIIRKEIALANTMIEEIEDREKRRNTTNVQTEAEIRAEMASWGA